MRRVRSNSWQVGRSSGMGSMCSVIIIYTTTTEHVLESSKIFSMPGSTRLPRRSVCGGSAVVTSMPPRSKARSVAALEFEAGLPRFVIDAGRGIEFMKGAGLESLVPDHQAVSFPEEDLDAVAAAIEKEEQVARERILAEKLMHHTEEVRRSLCACLSVLCRGKRGLRRRVEGTSVGSFAREPSKLPSRRDRGLEQG